MEEKQKVQDQNAHLTENIRYLVSLMPSIATASRDIGINRQQLNKYLNGSSQPSLRTMRRVAEAFDVAIEDLTLPPQDFARKMHKFRELEQVSIQQSLTSELTDQAISSSQALRPYCGLYFRYYALPSTGNQVLRSYAMIYQKDGLTFARFIERFSNAGEPWKIAHIRRSQHLLSFNGDRIQCIELPTVRNQKASPNFTIFYPTYMKGVQYLSGFLLGSFAFGRRPIFSASVALECLPVDRIRRSDLLNCGLLSFDALLLHSEIAHRLCGNDMSSPVVHIME